MEKSAQENRQLDSELFQAIAVEALRNGQDEFGYLMLVFAGRVALEDTINVLDSYD